MLGKPKAIIKPARFRPRPAAIKLPFPVSPALKVALLGSALPLATVTPFRAKNWQVLPGYGPQVLIGCAADLRRLAEQVQAGVLELPSLEHAIVVVTPYRGRPVDDVLRVILWQCFGVPVFEIYLSPDNSLAACECAAHEGWHIETGYAFELLHGELILASGGNSGIRTGLKAVVETGGCPCGLGTPRLMNIEPLNAIGRPREMAVSA